jgi:hypothetical protein
MALDALFKLDPTGPTSNSNYAGANIAENCAPSGINNALRALGQFTAQQLCYQSAAISASVSTNIATTSTGLFMGITGPNAINSFGVVPGEQPSAAVIRFLQFSSSASLSHGGSILLQGGVSRRTQPGDIGGYIHSGSSDVWYEFLYRSADGALAASGNSISVTTITNRSMSTSAISTVTLNAASASITTIGITALSSLNSVSASVGEFTLLSAGGRPVTLFHGRATNAAYTTLGTILPLDDSIPQITEGVEVLSITVTPTNAASVLQIDMQLHLGGGLSDLTGAALFIDATAGALAAAAICNGNTAQINTLNFSHIVSASNTTQRVYHVRAGSEAAADAFLNGDTSTRLYGGTLISSIKVTEFLP